jgi:hypothetical protein
MTDEQEHAQRMRKLYAGELIEKEIQFLKRIRELFEAVIQHRAQFNLIAEVVRDKLLKLIRSSFNSDLYSNIDAIFFSNEMGENVPFLKDGDKKVSISLGLFVNMLSHDLGEIFVHGNINKALKNFLPKCSGYRDFTEQVVGDPELEED